MVTKQEAKEIIRKMAKPTVEFAASILAHLYWALTIPQGEATAGMSVERRGRWVCADVGNSVLSVL